MPISSSPVLPTSSPRPVVAQVTAMCVMVGLLLTVFPLDRAYAQDTTGTSPQLPEIAPQEIEIRGERRIDFPSLQRQPLRGFATPASIPEVPATRTAYSAAYRQPLADLPDSVPQVEGVSTELASAPPPVQGRIDVGFGRYFSRFADGRLQFPFNETESLTLRADYEGTDGFQAFAIPRDLQTPYDTFNGGARFESHRDDLALSASLHGFVDDFTLYGADPLIASLATFEPDRTATSVGGAGSLEMGSDIEGRLSLAYDRTRIETSFDPEAPVSFQEGRVQAIGSVSFPIGVSEAHLDVYATTARQESDDFAGRAFTMDLGGTALAVRQDGIRVDVGGRLLTFSSPTDPANARTGDATFTFVAPAFDAQFTPNSTLTLFARNTPGLKTHDLATLHRLNPFVDNAPSLRPTLSTTDFAAGVTVTNGPVRVTADAGYQYAPSYLYFAPSDRDVYRAGLFDARYGSAAIVRGTGRVGLHGFDRVQTSVGVTIRDGELAATNDPIPYFSSVVADAVVTLSFADGAGQVEMTGTIEGERDIDVDQTRTLPPYYAIDVHGSYDVTELLSVLVRLENLSTAENLERYNRYPRPPAMLSVGGRIRW